MFHSLLRFHHLYADDIQMLAKDTLQSLGACCRELETCISSVQRWCAVRRLQLNPNKTEFICFGSAIQPQRLQTTGVSINIDGVDIKSVNCLRGVHLDSRLNVRFNISKIVFTCFFPSKTTVSSAPNGQRLYFPGSTIAMLSSPVYHPSH